MKKHPNKNIMIKWILKPENHKGQGVLRHISYCTECKKQYKTLEILLSPSKIVDIEPSPYLEKRILNSYKKIKGEEEEARFSLGNYIFRRKSLAFSSFALIVLMVFSYSYFFKTKKITKQITISLDNTRGNVFLNNQKVISCSIVSENSIIQTQENSVVELSFPEKFQIKLAQNTTLKVQKSFLSEKTNIYHFVFSLPRGNIYAAFTKNEKMAYSFITPSAKLNSIGTSFVLSATEKKTELYLTQGRLRIRALSTGRTMNSLSGNKYTVTNVIHSKKISPKDIKYVTSIKKYSGKEKSREKRKAKVFKKQRNQDRRNFNREKIDNTRNNTGTIQKRKGPKEDQKIRCLDKGKGKNQKREFMRNKFRKEMKANRRMHRDMKRSRGPSKSHGPGNRRRRR